MEGILDNPCYDSCFSTLLDLVAYHLYALLRDRPSQNQKPAFESYTETFVHCYLSLCISVMQQKNIPALFAPPAQMEVQFLKALEDLQKLLDNYNDLKKDLLPFVLILNKLHRHCFKLISLNVFGEITKIQVIELQEITINHNDTNQGPRLCPDDEDSSDNDFSGAVNVLIGLIDFQLIFWKMLPEKTILYKSSVLPEILLRNIQDRLKSYQETALTPEDLLSYVQSVQKEIQDHSRQIAFPGLASQIYLSNFIDAYILKVVNIILKNKINAIFSRAVFNLLCYYSRLANHRKITVFPTKHHKNLFHRFDLFFKNIFEEKNKSLVKILDNSMRDGDSHRHIRNYLHSTTLSLNPSHALSSLQTIHAEYSLVAKKLYSQSKENYFSLRALYFDYACNYCALYLVFVDAKKIRGDNYQYMGAIPIPTSLLDCFELPLPAETLGKIELKEDPTNINPSPQTQSLVPSTSSSSSSSSATSSFSTSQPKPSFEKKKSSQAATSQPDSSKSKEKDIPWHKMSHRQIEAKLKEYGFDIVREGKGSHKVFRSIDKKTQVTLSSSDKKGTLQALQKTATAAAAALHLDETTK